MPAPTGSSMRVGCSFLALVLVTSIRPIALSPTTTLRGLSSMITPYDARPKRKTLQIAIAASITVAR